MHKINTLKICYWNANGIAQRKLEIQQFMDQNQIDVLLVNETHLTDKNNFKIKGFDIHEAKHPAGTPRGGSAVILRPQTKIPPLRKPNGLWAKSDSEKAYVFANHLEQVFTQNYCPNTQRQYLTENPTHPTTSRVLKVKHKQLLAVIKHNI